MARVQFLNTNNGLEIVISVSPTLHCVQSTIQTQTISWYRPIAELLKNIIKVQLNASWLAVIDWANHEQHNIKYILVNSYGCSVKKHGNRTGGLMKWDLTRWCVVWVEQDGEPIVTWNLPSSQKLWTVYQITGTNDLIRRCIFMSEIRLPAHWYLRLAELLGFTNSL